MSTLSLQHLTALLAELGAEPITSVLDKLDLPPDAGRILSRPVDIYRVYLADILTRLAPGCTSTLAYESFQSTNQLSNGDLVLPVPRLRLKGKEPTDQCADFAAGFPDDHPLVQKPTGNGICLPVFFSKRTLSRLILPYVFQRQSSYGKDPHPLVRKKVIIEFSSPNIAKEFHAGEKYTLFSCVVGLCPATNHMQGISGVPSSAPSSPTCTRPWAGTWSG